MKKVFIILGVVALLLVVLAAASVNYVAFRGRQLDASSKAFVDASISAVTSTWSVNELWKRSSAGFKKETTENDINVVFAKLKQLGTLQKYGGSQGESKQYLTYGKNIKVAYYTASADFQNGSANFKIGLIQIDGQWQIEHFAVDSPILNK